MSIDELSAGVGQQATDGQDAGVVATAATTGESSARTTAATVDPPAGDVEDDSQNTVVDLARIGWLTTVVACLIAVLILVLQGYYGYAGVTLCVAISAAINLT
jgi:hypothetical protein